MKKQINELKELLAKYDETEIQLDFLEIMQDQDPENEKLDREWDFIYQNNYKTLMEASKILVEIMENKLDIKVAKKMLVTKRDQVEKILEKVK